MNLIKTVITSALLLASCLCLSAQGKGYDVFNPITKYLEQGNVESLSAWFSNNLEVTVLSRGGDSSKNQAKQILKTFFDSYKPRSFNITHTAGSANMKYVVGDLMAGGQTFRVTIFVSYQGDSYRIQQIKVDSLE